MTVTAIVLAAGLSTRMGKNKLLLPWHGKTIIQCVVEQLISSGIDNILLITGRDRERVEKETALPEVRHEFNALFEDGEMLHSLQCGIRATPEECESVLIVLGDQPQLEQSVIREILKYHEIYPDFPLIVPSYQMHKGHPWLVKKVLWRSIMDLTPPQNLKTFLDQHKREIKYVAVKSPSILTDLDTPEEYRNALQKSKDDDEPG
ncbi:MAG: nucleotidyltransferase family protein [Anaerolineaceae bacterium]